MNAHNKVKRGLKQTPAEAAYWQRARAQMAREYETHQAALRAAKPDPTYTCGNWHRRRADSEIDRYHQLVNPSRR